MKKKTKLSQIVMSVLVFDLNRNSYDSKRLQTWICGEQIRKTDLTLDSTALFHKDEQNENLAIVFR